MYIVNNSHLLKLVGYNTIFLNILSIKALRLLNEKKKHSTQNDYKSHLTCLNATKAQSTLELRKEVIK